MRRGHQPAPDPSKFWNATRRAHMLKKPLIIATLAATAAIATVSTRANAADPVLGALIGGGIGAAIGHDVNHHNGAAVGGVLGAITGAAIANDVNRSYYYGDGYAAAPA